MPVRLVALVLLALAPALAQRGVPPKANAADYPAHAQAGDVAVGAEYTTRSIPGPGGVTVDALDYLCVEVALFPPKGTKLAVADQQFMLRINGKKEALYPEAPGFVASALKYPDWERRPQLEGSGGLGGVGVILGQPRTVGRFPGDRRDSDAQTPPQPRAPDSTPGGVERQSKVRPEEVVVDAALPAGDFSGPIAGYLYFRYPKKTKSIKTLELLWTSAGRTTPVRLF
jgi:hypothetical protein